MRIRTVTCFINPQWPLDLAALDRAARLAAVMRLALEAADYEVQTVRLASVPFGQALGGAPQADELARFAQAIEAAALERGFEYVSLGPAFPDQPAAYTAIPAAIAATQNVFFTGLMTGADGRVSLPAVRACAAIIQQCAGLSPDGFANLRFAALANVAGGTPFFPAAYAPPGDLPAFAIATEAAGLAVEAFSQPGTLEHARDRLVQVVEGHAAVLCRIANDVAENQGAAFLGLDFTLAPFPEEAESFGAALERLGVPAAGRHGSLAAAAILADTLDRARYPRVGFNGLMMPVLEDYTLAHRAAEASLSVKDLLMFSAVCGAGLDTIPLPGAVGQAELAALLLDLAALAQRLDKPLTARLMPIPGKKAGQPTDFDFEFFENSRVMALEAEPLTGKLAGDESFTLQPRPRR
ncbi:MAG: DUF711 family protein [Chloroflexota bacterium]